MKRKSLKLNMVFNALNGILGIVFPLITFPYVSKILGVDNIGKFNFASSIVSYFSLFAGLGIGTYAIREGAKIREKKEELECFASQIFSINVLSTIISCMTFCVCCCTIPKLYDYLPILCVLSLQIPLHVIGVGWLFSVYERYSYKTAISCLSYCVSLICLFTLVRDENDVVLYAVANVIAVGASEIINCISARRTCRFKFTTNMKIGTHMKPVLLLFAMSLAVTVYVSSDTVILGVLCDDYSIGIYSVSTKVYSILKTIIGSVVTVSIPRLASLSGDGNECSITQEFKNEAKNIYNILLTVLVPAIVGVCMLRKEIILIISSEEYLSASVSLFILSIALFFCLGVYFWGQAVLVVLRKEKVLFVATIISALVNVILNFLLIPIWKQDAAAGTTLVSEVLAFAICWTVAHRIVVISGIWKGLLKITCGCLPIIVICIIVRQSISSLFLSVIISVVFSVLAYAFVEILLKNDAVYDIVSMVKKKIKK